MLMSVLSLCPLASDECSLEDSFNSYLCLAYCLYIHMYIRMYVHIWVLSHCLYLSVHVHWAGYINCGTYSARGCFVQGIINVYN